MRADLRAPIAEALAACTGPSLVFDLARIDDNLRAFAAAADAVGATVVFAAKSFPRREVRALAAQRFAGFDVASVGELAEVAGLGARVLSIVDPTARAGAAAVAEAAGARLIVGCETAAQVAAAPAGAALSLRLSASLTGRDPAVGAVLDGNGHRRSRFGVDVAPARRTEELRAMVAAAAGRPVGVHVHHGPVAATGGARFVATAQAALAAAAEAGFAPAFLDLGGAWHAVADLPAALVEIRAAVPREIELILEPGRVVAEGAGFAAGRVVVARELDDRPLRVVDVSRICHLRWSQVERVGVAPRPGTGRSTLVVGPTCYEDDVLGDWVVEPGALREGDAFVVRGVTGYAVAWNHGFAGVPPAHVLVVGERSAARG